MKIIICKFNQPSIFDGWYFFAQNYIPEQRILHIEETRLEGN